MATNMRVRHASHLNGWAISQAISRLSRETGHMSNVSSKRRNPNWAEIVSGGEQAVRMMFKDLQSIPVMSWDYLCLISEILGDGPDIPFEERGKVGLVALRYLAWGKSKGLI